MLRNEDMDVENMLDNDCPRVCRLCLNGEGEMVYIFDPKGYQGFRLWEIIKELLQVEVSKEDGLPAIICGECINKVREFKMFKTLCIKSKITILTMIASRGMVCAPAMDSNFNLMSGVGKPFLERAEAESIREKEIEVIEIVEDDLQVVNNVDKAPPAKEVKVRKKRMSALRNGLSNRWTRDSDEVEIVFDESTSNSSEARIPTVLAVEGSSTNEKASVTHNQAAGSQAQSMEDNSGEAPDDSSASNEDGVQIEGAVADRETDVDSSRRKKSSRVSSRRCSDRKERKRKRLSEQNEISQSPEPQPPNNLFNFIVIPETNLTEDTNDGTECMEAIDPLADIKEESLGTTVDPMASVDSREDIAETTAPSEMSDVTSSSNVPEEASSLANGDIPQLGWPEVYGHGTGVKRQLMFRENHGRLSETTVDASKKGNVQQRPPVPDLNFVEVPEDDVGPTRAAVPSEVSGLISVTNTISGRDLKTIDNPQSNINSNDSISTGREAYRSTLAPIWHVPLEGSAVQNRIPETSGQEMNTGAGTLQRKVHLFAKRFKNGTVDQVKSDLVPENVSSVDIANRNDTIVQLSQETDRGMTSRDWYTGESGPGEIRTDSGMVSSAEASVQTGRSLLPSVQEHVMDDSSAVVSEPQTVGLAASTVTRNGVVKIVSLSKTPAVGLQGLECGGTPGVDSTVLCAKDCSAVRSGAMPSREVKEKGGESLRGVKGRKKERKSKESRKETRRERAPQRAKEMIQKMILRFGTSEPRAEPVSSVSGLTPTVPVSTVYQNQNGSINAGIDNVVVPNSSSSLSGGVYRVVNVSGCVVEDISDNTDKCTSSRIVPGDVPVPRVSKKNSEHRETSGDVSELRKHQEEVHSEKKTVFKCSMCNATFSSPVENRQHFAKVHMPEVYERQRQKQIDRLYKGVS
ncbi:uncharacterized protein [Hetaerina americana]|uniref:uncharacterized protein n=1 Tax=Hetaerina americana TaxID=62018 RepID=UPI003A7F2391